MKLCIVLSAILLFVLVSSQKPKTEKLGLPAHYTFHASSLVKGSQNTRLSVNTREGNYTRISGQVQPDGTERTFLTEIYFKFNRTLFRTRDGVCDMTTKMKPQNFLYFPQNSLFSGKLCNGNQGRLWEYTDKTSQKYQICTGLKDKIPTTLVVTNTRNGAVIRAWAFNSITFKGQESNQFKINQECWGVASPTPKPRLYQLE